MSVKQMLQDPDTGRDLSSQGAQNFVHAPAAATQATITKPAAGAGKRNVCRAIAAYIACVGAQTPIAVQLRDGATGVGPVLWQGTLAAPVGGYAAIELHELYILGSDNTVMTLEFSAAGVAGSVQSVNLTTVESSL